MKNKIVMVVIAVFFTTIAVVAGIATPADKGNTGAVWSVDSTGNRGDYFEPGTPIYINGANLEPNTKFTWTITDQDSPLPDSQKPIVAQSTGDLFTDGAGNINRLSTGWSIPTNDYPNHNYRLNVNIYQSNGKTGMPSYGEFYTKRDTIETQIPEFPTIALPIISAIGILFIMHRRRQTF